MLTCLASCILPVLSNTYCVPGAIRHHGEQNRHCPCLCRVDCLLDIEGKQTEDSKWIKLKISQSIFFGHTQWHAELTPLGTEPMPPAVGLWSLNHWTAGEAPRRNVVFSAHHTRRYVMPIHLISADRNFYPLDTVVSIRFIHGKVPFSPL